MSLEHSQEGVDQHSLTVRVLKALNRCYVRMYHNLAELWEGWGKNVLLARNVYVADHQHAFADPTRAVIHQGITRIAPVEIADGAWLGENVVVGPGVRIGRGAVVGANAVVLEDVPDRSVAVGVPARVIRRLPDEGPAE